MSINPIDVALKLDGRFYTADLSIQLYELKAAEKKAWASLQKEMSEQKETKTTLWSGLEGLFSKVSNPHPIEEFSTQVKRFTILQLDSKRQNRSVFLVNEKEVLALEYPQFFERENFQRFEWRNELKALNSEIIRLHDSAEICEIAFSVLKKGPNQRVSLSHQESLRSFLGYPNGENGEAKEIIRSLVEKKSSSNRF